MSVLSNTSDAVTPVESAPTNAGVVVGQDFELPIAPQLDFDLFGTGGQPVLVDGQSG